MDTKIKHYTLSSLETRRCPKNGIYYEHETDLFSMNVTGKEAAQLRYLFKIIKIMDFNTDYKIKKTIEYLDKYNNFLFNKNTIEKPYKIKYKITQKLTIIKQNNLI